MTTALILLAALALDAALGEPRRGHPLVAFGRLASSLEHTLNRGEWADGVRRGAGLAGLLILLTPAVGVSWWLASGPLAWLFELVVLYLALGMQSLRTHALRVKGALEAGDIAHARRALAMMVSRDTAHLDHRRVAAGTVESVLENGNDAVFGAIFWFLVAGAPGVVAYRLVNTLDAMWGYRTPRLEAWGWAAARLDDLLNWLPARLVALTYGLLAGRPLAAWRCARRQGRRTASPNAGRVMAAGAGALGVCLGGPGRYHGRLRWRPRFGIGPAPGTAAIGRSIRLVQLGALLWAAGALLAGWLLCSDMAAILAR